MTTSNLDFLCKAIGHHEVVFDPKRAVKATWGKSHVMDKKSTFFLLHKNNFFAYAAHPKQSHPYPTLFWKGEDVVAYAPGSAENVYFLDKKTPSEEKKAFLKRVNPDFAMCIPPVEENVVAESSFWDQVFFQIKGIHIELLIVGLFINLFALSVPLFTLSVYDRVLPTFSTSTLWSLTIGILLIFVFDWLFKLHKTKLLSKANSWAGVEQDERILSHFMKERKMNASVGEQMDFVHLVRQSRESFLMSIVPAVADAPFVFIFLGLIYFLSPVIVWVPIFFIGVIFLLQSFIVPRHAKNVSKSLSEEKKTERMMHEILSSNTSIRFNNRTGAVLSKWRMHIYKFQQIVSKTQIWQQLGHSSVLSLAQVSAIIVLVVGVFQVHEGAMSIGALIACSILSSRAIAPAMNVVDAFSKLQKVMNIAKEYKRIHKQAVEAWVHSKETPEKLVQPECLLECKNVLCVFEGSPKPALDHISLKIKPGERVAILGRNGAGKSTLLNVLSGLITPKSGQILMDSVDLTRIPVTELRDYVHHMSQSPSFLSGTIRHAVAGDDDTDDAKLKSAIQRSGLQKVLESSGLGVDSDISENASNLSSGGRGMLSLAQAFYRNPKVMMMDEPTSHFDHQMELFVCGQIREWLNETGSTFILTTHRMHLMQLVDRLIVMDMGKIVLDGPKEAVLKKLGENNA